jgi:hypothetical protein
MSAGESNDAYPSSERRLLQDPHSLVCKEVIATFPPHLVAPGILAMSVTGMFQQPFESGCG